MLSIFVIPFHHLLAKIFLPRPFLIIYLFIFQRGCEQKREYNYFWRALMIINQMTKIWFRTSNFLRDDSLLVAW